MTDAISRSAVLEWLGYMIGHSIGSAEYAYKTTKRLVASAPALDVAPVVHARWIMNHFGAKCSNCLRLYCVEPSWSEKIKHMPPTWIYCPNCGARMDGEAE